MAGDWIDTILKLSQVGSTGLLLMALYGAVRGWWVPRWVYELLRERCDRMEALAKSATETAEQATRLAEQATRGRRP